MMLALLGISEFQLKQSLSDSQAESQTAESTSRALAAIESEIKGYIDTAISRERAQSAEPLSEERVAEQVLARLESLLANGQLSVQPVAPAPHLQPAPALIEPVAAVGAPVPPTGTEFAAVEPKLPEPAAPGGEVKIDQIHFLLNSTELTPGAQRKVMAAAEAIRAATPRQVKVIGFSDTVGPEDFNQTLSVRRATAVADLLQRTGIPVQYVEVSGLGESVLPEPTGDGVAEPLNRYVSIRMVH
jgi:outer membrane protein OmpA-like peptidoglycan-associated protein